MTNLSRRLRCILAAVVTAKEGLEDGNVAFAYEVLHSAELDAAELVAVVERREAA